MNQQAGLPPHQQQQQQDPNMNIVQDDVNDSDVKPSRRSGRRKIKIEYIEDKNRRHITFSKRKAGIMKKAYELSTLTGTQVLLLVVSETGLVYTFTTVKLQPIVTKPEGKNLIQACLNTPDLMTGSNKNDPYIPGNNGQVRVDMEKSKPSAIKETAAKNEPSIPQQQQQSNASATTRQAVQQPPSSSSSTSNYNNNTASSNAPVVVPGGVPAPYQQQQPSYGSSASANTTMPPMNTNNYGNHPNYMNPTTAPYQQQQSSPQQQQQQQQPYGSAPSYYGNQQAQQPHYMQQQQQGGGYWPSANKQEDDKPRRGGPNSK